jgi:hypothetical protein
MKWKRLSNEIVAFILSLAFVIVTILNMIGPLHINQTGAINAPGYLALYSFVYLLVSLIVIWGCYFGLKHHAKLLFFVLMILGVIFIFGEVFLWGLTGSYGS